jgi:hypothetical protein
LLLLLSLLYNGESWAGDHAQGAVFLPNRLMAISQVVLFNGKKSSSQTQTSRVELSCDNCAYALPIFNHSPVEIIQSQKTLNVAVEARQPTLAKLTSFILL